MKILILMGFLLILPACAYADIDVNRLTTAIYKAENSKKFPYGILVHFKTTSPRQACKNSIKNAYKRWLKSGSNEDFIIFMGRRYSPPDINPNWVRLVKYFYKKEIRNES